MQESHHLYLMLAQDWHSELEAILDGTWQNQDQWNDYTYLIIIYNQQNVIKLTARAHGLGSIVHSNETESKHVDGYCYICRVMWHRRRETLCSCNRQLWPHTVSTTTTFSSHANYDLRVHSGTIAHCQNTLHAWVMVILCIDFYILKSG